MSRQRLVDRFAFALVKFTYYACVTMLFAGVAAFWVAVLVISIKVLTKGI